MPEVIKKKRIFQIAKELNISHLEIIQFLASNGTPANSHMAPVTPEVYDVILLEFSKDKLQIERHRKEQARKVVVSKIQQKQSDMWIEYKSLKSLIISCKKICLIIAKLYRLVKGNLLAALIRIFFSDTHRTSTPKSFLDSWVAPYDSLGRIVE